jgi:drug/metabolite transporter (DMT)-like permease
MIYCSGLALVFLKKKLYRHHYTSICTVILGVLVVGYSYVLNSNKPSSSLWLGLFLLQVA